MASIDDDDSLRQISNMVARLFLPTGVAWWVTGVKTAVYCYNPLAKHEYMYRIIKHHHIIYRGNENLTLRTMRATSKVPPAVIFFKTDPCPEVTCNIFVKTVMTWEWAFVTWATDLGIGNQELGASPPGRRSQCCCSAICGPPLVAAWPGPRFAFNKFLLEAIDPQYPLPLTHFQTPIFALTTMMEVNLPHISRTLLQTGPFSKIQPRFSRIKNSLCCAFWTRYKLIPCAA